MQPSTEARLTCPECGHVQELRMPTDYCLFFHECVSCGSVLRPRPGDDCVFCSYADADCPPKLLEEAVPQP